MTASEICREACGPDQVVRYAVMEPIDFGFGYLCDRQWRIRSHCDTEEEAKSAVRGRDGWYYVPFLERQEVSGE